MTSINNNSEAMSSILLSLLEANEERYMRKHPLRVFCGTYNVNGKRPDENLRTWLMPFSSGSEFDIYAVGFQEVVDLSPASFILKTDWQEREESWQRAVAQELLRDNKFRFVDKIRMYGVFLLIFARVELTLEPGGLHEVYKAFVPTGVMDSVGNKGSVAVSMRVFETRLCFVCSHFASDVEKIEKRNSDYRSSKARLRFDHLGQMPSSSLSSLLSDSHDLDSHDLIFWMGDFNYRLDPPPHLFTPQKVLQLIYESDFETLMQHDQLSNERRRYKPGTGGIFEFFNEGEIRFRPTYKYQVQTDIYELTNLVSASTNNVSSSSSTSLSSLSTAKVKLPSWTDRIVWQNLNVSKCDLVKYSCVSTITTSDHKPVYAVFDVEARQRDEEAYKKLYDELVKDADRRHNEEMPRVAIMDDSDHKAYDFNFGECNFYASNKQFLQLKVKNEGLTRASIVVFFYDDELMARVDTHQQPTRRSKHQWVSIQPQHKDRVAPGDTVCIELGVMFTKQHLARLNREPALSDILVVRCQNGNDAFATLTCAYRRTIMGFSLKALSTLGNEPNSSKFFAKANQDKLVTQVEPQAAQLERRIEDMCSLVVQQQRKSGNANRADEKSWCEFYLLVLEQLREDIVTGDVFFGNELSTEYAFLMEYLIEEKARTTATVGTPSTASLLKSQDEEAADAMARHQRRRSFEEEKSLALEQLSSGDFGLFRLAQFDLELLAELLVDLLNALPAPLVPTRFCDHFCAYVLKPGQQQQQQQQDAAAYALLVRLFDKYMPRSHLKLFELIVRLLQLYNRETMAHETAASQSLWYDQYYTTSYMKILANACFQVSDYMLLSESEDSEKSALSSAVNNSEMLDMNKKRCHTALSVVQLFVEHHKKFITLTS